MPSPDIRQFVDLTLYDLESQSIYLRALDYMKVVFPEFQPTEGSLESVILQSMAIEVASRTRTASQLRGHVPSGSRTHGATNVSQPAAST